MSVKGYRKPDHKRTDIVRTFKMNRLMVERIHAACDENHLSFSHFMREAVNNYLFRYNHQKQLLEQHQEQLL
jgi:ribosomal protein L20